MQYICGLGNPGLKYKKTRHNAGFLVIDELAKRHNIKLKASKFDALLGQGSIGNERVTLIKPTTYMNNSGWAVSAALDYYNADTKDLVVLYDDIDLPLGTLRIREKGSAGTHNGMRSIISYLKSDDFKRIRIGIGKPDISLTGYVLGKFPKDQKEDVDEMLSRAADAAECVVEFGVTEAQAKYQVPGEKNNK